MFKPRERKTAFCKAILLGAGLCVFARAAGAMSSHTTPNGLFRLDYYDAGEGFTGRWYLENMRVGSLYDDERNAAYMTSQGTLPDWQKERLNVAADYCDRLLKHTKSSKQAADLAVTVNNDLDNAAAEGSYTDLETNGQPVSVTTPNAVLNHGKVLTAEDGPAGFVVIRSEERRVGKEC